MDGKTIKEFKRWAKKLQERYNEVNDDGPISIKITPEWDETFVYAFSGGKVNIRVRFLWR